MADTEVTVKVLELNGGALFSTDGIATTASNAAYIDISTMDGSKVILLVGKVGGKAGSIVVKDGAEYTGGAAGDFTKLTTAGVGRYVLGPFETARVKDSDGHIRVLKATEDTDVWVTTAILLP